MHKITYVPYDQYYPIISLVTMKPNFSMMHDLNPYVHCRGVNLMKVKMQLHVWLSN
jgi:hypothetical protein